MHNIKQPYSNTNDRKWYVCAVEAQQFVCMDYVEVMTGKDGACAAAAIHDTMA